MSTWNAARKRRILDRITAAEAALAAADAAFLTLTGKDIKSYRFEDSTEGLQSATRISAIDAMKVIQGLEAQIESLYRSLGGGNLVTQFVARR